MANTTHDEHAGQPAMGHVTPVSLLFKVWLLLVVLTVVTVMATWVDLGKLNLWLALAIATVKASAVLLYFMHLRWDRPMNGVVLISSIFFVILFIGIALMDTKEYEPEKIPGHAPAIEARSSSAD